MSNRPRAAEPRAAPGRVARRAPHVVAIDIGSSSVRVGLRDIDGAAVPGSLAQVPYTMTVDDAGAVSVEPARLLGVVTDALDRFVARAPRRALGSIAAVGTSCFLHSVAGLDERGQAITPLLTWADTTSAAAAAGLRRRLDETTLWQETGSPLHASYWPAKVLHLRGTTGGRARRFAGAGSLLFGELTGVFTIDLSEASGTGLLARRSSDWHGGLLGVVEVRPGDLPRIAGPFESARLTGWSAARWPALANVPWFAPWSDAWCGNVGLGQIAGGGAALQVGTSGAMRIVRREAVPPVPTGLFAHRLPDGTALVGGQLSEGGGTVAAIARLLDSTPARLEAAAKDLPPDGHGLTVLPFLAGERGPGYRADARGTIAGLGLGSSGAELHLAVLEAIAFRFASLDARLAGTAAEPIDVTASGGALAKSPLWTAIIAAALGRTIRHSTEGEASSRGAALLALTAAGVIGAPADVPPPASVAVVPDPHRVDAYRRAAVRQAALYATLLGRQAAVEGAILAPVERPR